MSRNKKTENSGIIYVQNVVRKSGCVFSQISLENDFGNDCYIEFFTNDVATSFCAFAQIKSGKSYKDKTGYKIPTDRNHLEYWRNHANPIVGIVYDEQLDKAFWINISEYLLANPSALKTENHTIRISTENVFTAAIFNDFKNHFIEYIKAYKGYENYGRSLQKFANFNIPRECYEGMKSLYSNHRERKSTWLYIISTFSNIKEDGIRLNILLLINNYIETPDILLNGLDYKPNEMREMKQWLSQLLSKYFRDAEVAFAISYMREGVVRGSYPYLLYLVLELVENIDEILERMAFEETTKIDDRIFTAWLYGFYAQHKSVPKTLATLDRFINVNGDSDEIYTIKGVRETIAAEGGIQIG